MRKQQLSVLVQHVFSMSAALSKVSLMQVCVVMDPFWERTHHFAQATLVSHLSVAAHRAFAMLTKLAEFRKCCCKKLRHIAV